MNTIKHFFSLAILTLLMGSMTTDLFGQNDPHYSMFMFNKLSINPAYAGDKEALTFTGHYRNQWQGIDGAPKTFTFAAHTPLFKKRVGLGLSVISDKIGIYNINYFDVSYAYRMKVSDDATLSIGVQGQIDHTRVDWTKLDPLDQGDGMINVNPTTKLNPNFGLGVYYSHPKYYIGASAPRVFKTAIYDTSNSSGIVSINSLRSYYLMGGLITRLSKNVKFQPGVLLTKNDNAPLDLDLNFSFVFMDALWIGGSYRLEDSFDAIVQYQFSKQLKAAVAVDLTLSELRNYSPGSFEVMLEYLFMFDGARYNNIRYF